MKHLHLFLLCFASLLNAQKQDYIWLNCHTYGQPDGTQLNFNHDPVQIDVVQRKLYMIGINASICDADGNLLLYTNGRSIANFEEEIIENGDSINYGFWYNNVGEAGYPVLQGAFFLQKPDSENLYYLFHMFVGFENGPTPVPMSLWYSIIDMEANNGKGRVIEKNIPLLEGYEEINYTQATAVRHANGRDWWVIVPNRMGPQYYRFLFTPNGIDGPWVQEVGFLEATTDFYIYSVANRRFSPDGSMFAENILQHFTQLFDFDRCTGLFSNPRLIMQTSNPPLSIAIGHVVFSPSGKYLYVTAATNNGPSLFQYSTESNDISSTEVLIYNCPVMNQVTECAFSSMLLAPDGKIYLNEGIDSTSYSIIHEPDKLGLDCNFELNDLVFPVAYPNGSFPYWPNYRLGALEGSGCDTIVSKITDNFLKKETFDVYPNPASDKVFFASPMTFTGMISIKLLNSTGQLVSVMAQAQWGGSISMPLQQAAPGLYFYEIEMDGASVQQGKLVVSR